MVNEGAECHTQGWGEPWGGAWASAGTFLCVLGCSETQLCGAAGLMVLKTSWRLMQLCRPLQSAARGTTFQTPCLCPLPCLSLTQDYELEAEKLRSLLDLENGRSSHVSKRARLQSPTAKVREEVSSAGWASLELPGPLGSRACRPPRCTPSRETGLRSPPGCKQVQ